MKVQRLRLTNFMCFEHEEFEFEPGFNLLVGDNGSGKSSILEGLAAGLGPFVHGIDPSLGQEINPARVRIARFEFEEVPDVQPQFPCEVSVAARVGGRDEWSVSAERSFEWSIPYAASGLELGDRVRAGESVNLPVLRFFGAHRDWVFQRNGVDVAIERNRLAGYVDCLNPRSPHKHLEEWMEWQTGVAAQRGRPMPQLGAVEAAVRACVGDIRRFYYDILNRELRVEFASGTLMPFALLSAGYRGLVAIIADVAWRAAVLNPHLGADAPAQAEGVVLIDELDLHLHPKWQRRIIADLCAAFPNIQFIATTHSPFIIQALEDGHLIDLSEPKGASWRHKSIEDIAEEIQGVENPQRSWRFEAMTAVAEEYYRLLGELRNADDERVVDLRQKLDALMERFADDPAYVATLKMERVAAEAERNQ